MELTTFAVGWLGGWLENWRVMLISTQMVVEVEIGKVASFTLTDT